MGAARRRRMAAVKRGITIVPSDVPRLVTESVLLTKAMSDMISQRYTEYVEKPTCPTRSDFIEKLIIAGLMSFDNFRTAQAHEPPVVSGDDATSPPAPGGTDNG